MRVAFFVYEFPTISETFIVNQIIGIKRAGHFIDIFSRRRIDNVPIHKLIVENGLLDSVYYLDQLPHSRFRKLKALIFTCIKNLRNHNIFFLLKAILKNPSNLSIYDYIPFLDKPNYDVVHAHFGINGKYVVELQNLGLFEKAKFITTFHGYDLSEVFSKTSFYNSLFDRCECFTVNSEYSKRLLLNLGAPEDYIHLLPAGLDLGKFGGKNRNGRIENCVKLLFVGRLVKLKGPDRFIEICRILKYREHINLAATIVGDGEMLQEVKQMVSGYKLEKEVEITGARTQEEIVEMMAGHDIFLQPGITYDKRAETQGLVVQEAQAMKLPVIISNAGGMHEGLLPDVTGFVVDETDVQGFVEKIKLLVANPSLRKKMGEEGRRFVMGKYDITNLNKRLIQLYQTGNSFPYA